MKLTKTQIVSLLATKAQCIAEEMRDYREAQKTANHIQKREYRGREGGLLHARLEIEEVIAESIDADSKDVLFN